MKILVGTQKHYIQFVLSPAGCDVCNTLDCAFMQRGSSIKQRLMQLKGKLEVTL